MGIKNLTKLIKAHAPEAMRQVDISAYKGKRVAVDGNLFVYKFLHGHDANPNRALYGFLELARWFRRFQIEPIFVFDGRKLEAKRVEIERRWCKRKRLLCRVEECRHEIARMQSEARDEEPLPQLRDEGEDAQSEESNSQSPSSDESAPRPDSSAVAVPTATMHALPRVSPARLPTKRNVARVQNELACLQQQIVNVTPQQIMDCQQMLKLAGLPTLTAEHEAEATCAAMCASGQVDAVITEDMDALTFGSAVVLRDCRPQKPILLEIRLNVLLQCLGLTQEQFVDLCILCGCDFSGTLRNINHQDALQLIRQYGSIEAILEQRQDRQLEHFTFKVAREIFLHPPTLSDEAFHDCCSVPPVNPRALDDFLRKRAMYRPRNVFPTQAELPPEPSQDLLRQFPAHWNRSHWHRSYPRHRPRELPVAQSKNITSE